MKLIVDSGSTKTDWCFAQSSDTYVLVQTDGINPIVQSFDEIVSVVQDQMLTRAKQQFIDVASLENVFFYGAGCTPEHSHIVEEALHSALGESVSVYVESDLLAAARALCGTHPGIACILGTGSNSCYFDGDKIKEHTPALGYILGDEGSGAVLGRTFINGILKGTLPQELRDEFFEEYHTSQADIINNVYHSALPNRFLASLSKFILPRISNEKLEALVVRNFESFIINNVKNYAYAEPVINAVGSVAYLYHKQLEQAANRQGYRLGKILKSPLEGLLKYHFVNN
ncbi:ATPase [Leyella stercorea]|uniref:ATPase n=1 Tax=Leyella stercorea TaxID=363265 RepID=UPI001A48F534|nr:ATPase [Leyella stercorea]MBL6516843.1 ATPase [Leyella stercorea]